LSGIEVAEANAKIPRNARFDDDIVSALGFTLFFLALWLIPAAWGTYDEIKNLQIRDVLRSEGNEAKGEITESYPGRRESGVDVHYRFSLDGAYYTGRAQMIGGDYRVLRPGGTIPVRYLPKDPRVNQPVDWRWFSVSYMIFLLLGLVLLVAAGALIIGGLRKKKLTRMGIVVEGRVTGCAPDRKVFTVYYEFTTEDNLGMEGSTRMPEECAAGDSIPVMYLRSNPKRNDFYPL